VLWRLKVGKFFFVPGVLLLLVSAQFIRAALPGQQNPMALIQSGTERAIQILHESQRKQAPSLRHRKDEILVIVNEYFNFEEMAKRSLGRPWKEQTPEKRQEFAQLFKQLLFNYRLRRDGGQWQVYDVAVEGISFVDNYRGQFGSILANESFDSLLIRLRQKVDQSS
jgi:phospholipid transport system substrate-binding protein